MLIPSINTFLDWFSPYFHLYTDVQKTTLRSKTRRHRAAKVDICVKTCNASLPEFQWGYIIIHEQEKLISLLQIMLYQSSTQLIHSDQLNPKTQQSLKTNFLPTSRKENALKCLLRCNNRSILFFFIISCELHVRIAFSRNDIFVVGYPGRFSPGWRRVRRARQSMWQSYRCVS